MMFDQILGHKILLNQLFTLYKEGKLAHTLLFHGPESVGKHTSAKALTAAILEDSCQLSPAINFIDAGTHPNFFILTPEDGKKEISVERSRELTSFLKGTPAIPGYRIAIIDAADQLNRQAANALLKMLEEPPAKTLIILLAHQLGRVLPTILSRSTKIAFHPISDAEMQNIFPHLSEDTLQFISGCPGRAQENKDIKQPLQHIGKALMLALQKNFAALQAHLDSLPESMQEEVMSLLPLFMKRLLLMPIEKQSEGMKTLLQKLPHSGFIKTYQAFEDYIRAATQAYIPLKDILYGSILVLSDPTLSRSLKINQL